ncbi:hypothetical protein DAPPUDRAFT_110849 [Daphnia pulex]|uniref:Nuclear pore complex protein NUP96 C-terminal domain-containing protein n=1 Tax=Daphnia pulex TaxID=6669 RepID=E9H7C1_DAPPU|nr:hypothetical protein DAPPUDRAFT_110849 [Daphnia pulex]|eukprot:EFX72350.1 hypothetical protein DAPPUDRAFT_110849 [Daphnia pulex]
MEKMETLNEAVHQSFSVPSAGAKVYGDSSLHWASNIRSMTKSNTGYNSWMNLKSMQVNTRDLTWMSHELHKSVMNSNSALYFCLKLTPLPFIRANLSQLPIFLIILVKWLLKEIDADKVIRLVGFGNTMHLQLVSPGIGSEEMSGKPLRARSTPLKEWIGLDQARRWPIIYAFVKDILGRHTGQEKDEQCELFLVEKLCVPSQWIEECRAVKALYAFIRNFMPLPACR